MSKRDSERQRRKRAAMRRKRALEAETQLETRLIESGLLGREALRHLEAGDVPRALDAARRASDLIPSWFEPAELYLQMAEEGGDVGEQARALGRLVPLVEPDIHLFARLAVLRLADGDPDGALEAAGRARGLLRPRMKERKRWLAAIEYVENEARDARPAAAKRTVRSRQEASTGEAASRPGEGGARASNATDAKVDAPRASGTRTRESKTSEASRDAPKASSTNARGSRTAEEKSRGPKASATKAHGSKAVETKAPTSAAPATKARSSKAVETTAPTSAAPARKGHAPALSDAAEPRPTAAPGASRPDAKPAPAESPLASAVLYLPFDVSAGVAGIDALRGASLSTPEDVALAALAARLRDAESYDRLFALERARGVIRFSHQEETARKVLGTFRGRALLADEVGLGKTIEAGLVLSEYQARGRVGRALVIAPPSLVHQWREELSSKFGIDARTTEDAAFRSDPDRFWRGGGVAVASLATARSPRQRDLVTAEPWDLVIVDEAHTVKNAATESYALVSRITSRFLLLLTATPVENEIEELYNLVSLIRPGQLGGRAPFLRRFSDTKLGASEAARTELRGLLAQVMVRNTRALSGVDLPPRFARTLLVQPDPAEHELYEQLARALRALGARGRTGLLLSILLQEAGSSPLAVRATLGKIAANPAHPAQVREALEPAMRVARDATGTGKAAALLRTLEDADGGTVVFTRFRATLDFLAALLSRAGVPHEAIDGNVPAPLRAEAIERVRRTGGVLLSTEVGAEGLNLQFLRHVVNFDLPWNPMRIEQRIGRVHRIGQDQPVEIVNFCLAGSIEERILAVLDERINLFELVVGELEMILGYLEDERDFADLVFDAFADPDADARDRSFSRIGDALAAARGRYDNVRRYDESFFRDELSA